MATICYSDCGPHADDNRSAAEALANKIYNTKAVNEIGKIVADAIVQSPELAVRTAFDWIDNISAIFEFSQDPSWRNLAATLPFIPSTGNICKKLPVLKIVDKINDILRRYPQVVDMRTGQIIPFPSGIQGKVEKGSRVPWNKTLRGEYISEWYKHGYDTPKGGWEHYDIHHIQPREYGGSNDFLNLVPVERETHKLFNDFWRYFEGL